MLVSLINVPNVDLQRIATCLECMIFVMSDHRPCSCRGPYRQLIVDHIYYALWSLAPAVLISFPLPSD